MECVCDHCVIEELEQRLMKFEKLSKQAKELAHRMMAKHRDYQFERESQEEILADLAGLCNEDF